MSEESKIGVREVLGIVDSYARFARPPFAFRWALAPWRFADGDAHLSVLHVDLEVPDARASAQLADAFPDARQRIIRLLVAAVAGESRRCVQVGEHTFVARDPKLEAAAVERAKPRTIKVDGLGRLSLDRDRNGLTGHVELAGGRVPILIVRGEEEDTPDQDAATAHEALRHITLLRTAWDTVIDRVVAELYPVYTSGWAKKKAVSAEEFRRQLRPSDIEVNAPRTTVLFSGKRLFPDHDIEVRLENGVLSEIGIAG